MNMTSKKTSMSRLSEGQKTEINPTRLAIARERSRLTKKQLAEIIGKTPRAITAWESQTEVLYPSDSTIEALASVLGYPKDFFFGDDIEYIDLESVSFRALSKMTARKRNAALAAGSMGIYLNHWIEENFSLPRPNVLDLRGEAPDVAATMLRQYWGIGERPIKNVVHLLEANGVRVFSLAEDCNDVDAYSFWKEETPYIFLNTKKTAERSRFDGAHELGHLILHKHGAPSGQEAEKEADEFASAFLMPANSLYATPIAFSISYLVRIKRKWNVSLLALVVRLHRLGIISDWKYRSLCIEIQQTYGRTEPNGMDRESSQVLDKVFRSLWAEGMTINKLARELALPIKEIQALIFGLIPNAKNAEIHDRPFNLHVVKPQNT